MGVTIMLVTGYLGAKFFLLGKRLSRGFAFNLAGEFVASLVTTCFAAAQLLDVMHFLSPVTQGLMRIVLFSGMLFSSLHMARLIHQIENGE